MSCRLSLFSAALPLAATLVLGACATRPAEGPAASATPAEGGAAPQMEFALSSGTYRCEDGVRVDVQRDAGAPDVVQVSWKGARHRLQRNLSYSGLPRYEDEASGLVWIDLPWKSVLLDGKSGKPLVSECRGAASAKRS